MHYIYNRKNKHKKDPCLFSKNIKGNKVSGEKSPELCAAEVW